jgi:hypothetical protein
MRGVIFIAALSLSACMPYMALGVAPEANCIPEGYDRPKLDVLKAAGFEIADTAARQMFARGITDCLASSDPALRDGIAFEALSTMARAKQLTPETMKAIIADLKSRLQTPDPAGFNAPFAALGLSEMARADRIEAYLSDEELSALLIAARTYMASITDYRGYDDHSGWRHAVAHTSDLLMQLAMNPRLDRSGLDVVRAAVATQVAPHGHAYVYGESARLARPIWLTAQRDKFTAEEWSAWLATAAGPGEFGSWEAAVNTEAGLARIHNVRAFANALWLDVTTDEDIKDDVLVPGLQAVLRELS